MKLMVESRGDGEGEVGIFTVCVECEVTDWNHYVLVIFWKLQNEMALLASLTPLVPSVEILFLFFLFFFVISHTVVCMYACMYLFKFQLY